jgi:Protein of unknown function (DUF1559)
VFPFGTIATSLNTSSTFPGNISWMPMILPYIDQAPLYNQLSPLFATTQSSSFPSDLMNTLIPPLMCPSDPNTGKQTTGPGVGNPPPDYNDGFCGNYLVCNGNEQITVANSASLSGMFAYRSRTRMRDLTDGTSNTVMLGEINLVPEPGNNRDWRGRYYRSEHLSSMFSTFLPPNTTSADLMRTCEGNPASPSYAPCTGSVDPQVIYARSRHTGGVHISLGDGSGRFISENIDTGTWRALGSKAGGEVVGEY